MSVTCQHERFGVHAKVTRLEDIGAFQADISIKCEECGTPFMFMGVPAGLSWTSPRASMSAEELRCPIKPYDGTLAASASFEAPTPVNVKGQA